MLMSACGGGGSGSTSSYAVQVTVSGLAGTGLVLQNNGTDNLTVATNGDSTFSVRQPSGTPYAVTVLIQPGNPAQGCVVTNGSGTISTADVVGVAVVCRNAARFAYVANYSGSNLSQFSVGADGRLTPLAPTFLQTGLNPTGVAIDPLGRYLYVANENGGVLQGTVSQYTIGGDGRLTAMAPATVLAGIGPTGIVVDPSGRYVYVTNDGGGVSQYTIGGGGALFPMAAPIVAAGLGPAGIAVDPSGRFAYVANDGGTVSEFAIANDGSLVALAPGVLAGTNPSGVTVDPLGRAAYVTNTSALSNNVSHFALAADGRLSPFAPAAIAAGATPVALATDPLGRFAWVANFTGNTIAPYRVNADGSLSQGSAVPVLAGIQPAGIVTDPTGRFLYATQFGGNAVGHFSINADGSLVPISTTVGQGNGPLAIAIR